MTERVDVIREMIGEYEYEISVARTRLDDQRLRRGKLEFVREVLVEHGENAEADRLRVEIHDLDNTVVKSRTLLEKLEKLSATYRRLLEKFEA